MASYVFYYGPSKPRLPKDVCSMNILDGSLINSCITSPVSIWKWCGLLHIYAITCFVLPWWDMMLTDCNI